MRYLRVAAIFLCFSPAARAGVSREDILKEQDLRIQDSALLRKAAASDSAEVRRQAYLSMGRIQSEAYLESLLKGLHDGDPAAREQAVFSLGQLGLAEPELSTTTIKTACIAVEKLSGGVSGSLKQASVEALGKLGGAEAEPSLLSDLKDGDKQVRGEAALALFRQRFLKRVPEYSTAAVTGLVSLFKDSDPGVRWRAVYAFSRFAEPRAARALDGAAGDKDRWVRFFACRALGLLKVDRKDMPSASPLGSAARDSDYLVRLEVMRAAAGFAVPEGLAQLLSGEPSAHVRAAAADTIAANEIAPPSRHANFDLLYRLWHDESAMVRGQALFALRRVWPDDALSLLDEARSGPRWRLRSKAYEALGEIPGSEALLKEGIKDKDTRVASAALEALAKSSSTEVDGILDKILRDPNATLEMAGTAAEAAKKREAVALLDAERAAYEGSLARQYPEFSDDLVEAYNETLKAHPEVKAAPLVPHPAEKIELSPFINEHLKPTTVILDTERGEIDIELAVEDSPLHAAAFIASVKKGLYDGTIWHRIVSGFVAQGGDPRGSGWGDAGFLLRDEINRRPFARGAVGMPKAGKDTGGCQLFITYVPTPHLDGRYTVFGQVTAGMDVVDRLEPGDRITRARLK